MDEHNYRNDTGTDKIESEQGTMLVKKDGCQSADLPICPMCKNPTPLNEVFCRNCGATLKDFEIRDQRSSLGQDQVRGQQVDQFAVTMDGRVSEQPVVRRTSTYLGKIRRIEPVPVRFDREEEGKGREKYDSAVLIVGVVSISLLVVVVIVLVLMLVRYL